MELYERIAFVRKAAGLTQEQLGEKLGVTRQAVSKWESNQATPDALTIARLCAELGVSADFVLLGKEPEDASAPAAQTTITCPCCGKETTQSAPKCQVCSYDFFPTPPDDDKRYAVLLLSCGDLNAAAPMIMRFTGWDNEQCKQYLDAFLGLTDVRMTQLLLRRGLSRSAALHIASNLETCGTTRIVEDAFIPGTDTPAHSDEELATLSSAMSPPAPADEKEGIGFWGIVGAVVVGIIIASFL